MAGLVFGPHFWWQVTLFRRLGDRFFESVLAWGLVFWTWLWGPGWFLDLVLVAGPVFRPRFGPFRTSGARFWDLVLVCGGSFFDLVLVQGSFLDIVLASAGSFLDLVFVSGLLFWDRLFNPFWPGGSFLDLVLAGVRGLALDLILA